MPRQREDNCQLLPVHRMYTQQHIPVSTLRLPPLLLQAGTHHPVFRSSSRGPSNEISLPPPSQVNFGCSTPAPPFRGGPHPPVVLDESRHIPSHTPLAPMEIDRPLRDYPSSRDNATRGPIWSSKSVVTTSYCTATSISRR